MPTPTESAPAWSTSIDSSDLDASSRGRSQDSGGEGSARYFGSEMKIIPGVTIPLRSMLVGAANPILISPVVTREESNAVQNLTVLVAPSLLHHLSLGSAIQRYRPREVWGPPGLAQKTPELLLRVFGVDPWPHSEELEFELVEGAPKRNEVVFFHKASGAIYTADLVFNIREPVGFLTPIAFRLMGIHKRLGAAKMWRGWVKDRAAFQRSMRRILAWDFDRLVMAHGDILDQGGHAAFERAFQELELL